MTNYFHSLDLTGCLNGCIWFSVNIVSRIWGTGDQSRFRTAVLAWNDSPPAFANSWCGQILSLYPCDCCSNDAWYVHLVLLRVCDYRTVPTNVPQCGLADITKCTSYPMSGKWWQFPLLKPIWRLFCRTSDDRLFRLGHKVRNLLYNAADITAKQFQSSWWANFFPADFRDAIFHDFTN